MERGQGTEAGKRLPSRSSCIGFLGVTRTPSTLWTLLCLCMCKDEGSWEVFQIRERAGWRDEGSGPMPRGLAGDGRPASHCHSGPAPPVFILLMLGQRFGFFLFKYLKVLCL